MLVLVCHQAAHELPVDACSHQDDRGYGRFTLDISYCAKANGHSAVVGLLPLCYWQPVKVAETMVLSSTAVIGFHTVTIEIHLHCLDSNMQTCHLFEFLFRHDFEAVVTPGFQETGNFHESPPCSQGVTLWTAN